MDVSTGKGSMPLISVIAILSISLLVNLPGLAVSPILANLDTIFPGTQQLEVQLLTILPNLFIIPFVLLSGKIASYSSKIKLLLWALIIYLLSGVIYLVTDSMWQLIVVSCLLGVGCGLLIPLAASLITDNFKGSERMKMLGIKSGVSNLALVVATLIVGWLSKGNWHLPFIVYLLPVIPLFLFGYIKAYANLPVSAEEAKKEEKSIEDTFGELDLLARKLEDKETPLEESFRLYRQGMELLKNLNGRLDTVEKKMLQMNEDGTFREF